MRTTAKTLLLLLAALLCADSAQAQNYYLGPWVWQTEVRDSETGQMVPSPAWVAPAGTIGMIDLRTLPQQGTPGPAAQGFGLFVTSRTLGAGYLLIGSGPAESVTISNQLRNGWQTRLGFRPTGVSLAEIVWEMLTTGSDPTGQSRVKPLMPGTDGQLRLRLGQFSRSERFTLGQHPHTDKVLAVYREAYREAVDNVLAGRVQPDLPAQMVDFWREQYGIAVEDRAAWEQFVPEELRGFELVAHATTITEDFNCADSTDETEDLDCDLDWTEATVDIDIVGNALNSPSGAGATVRTGRAESDLSTSNHYGQAAVVVGSASTSRFTGPTARYASAAETFYWAQQAGGASSSGILRPTKVVTGTATQLGAGTSQTIVATKRVSISGSTLDVYSGGSSVESITDTAISSGTRAGVAFNNASNQLDLDDFEAADIAAPAGGTKRTLTGAGK